MSEGIRPLPDTGERMIPESTHYRTFLDHINRYRFALAFVFGKRVLDIACGEGYGAAALARAGAAQVVGIDIAPEVVEHARRKYGIDARVGSADQIELPDGSVDVVVSFETIEHLCKPAAFLREVVRVLAPGGVLILSTPNQQHVPSGDSHNRFHHSEMTEAEFRWGVEGTFRTVRYFAQELLEARLLSVHAVAALHTRPRLRPLSGMIFRMRPWLCSEYGRSPRPEYRADPVLAITDHRPTWRDRLFDTSYIRPSTPGTGDDPVFFLAIASDPYPQPELPR